MSRRFSLRMVVRTPRIEDCQRELREMYLAQLDDVLTGIDLSDTTATKLRRYVTQGKSLEQVARRVEEIRQVVAAGLEQFAMSKPADLPGCRVCDDLSELDCELEPADCSDVLALSPLT